MARWKRPSGGAFGKGRNKPPGGTHKRSEATESREMRKMLGEAGVRAAQFGLTAGELRTVVEEAKASVQHKAAYKKILRIMETDFELFARAVKALARDATATKAAYHAPLDAQEKAYAVQAEARAEMRNIMAEVNRKLSGK